MIRINSNLSYMDGIQIRVWSRQLKQLYINWNISWGLLVCFIQKFQTAIRYFYSYSFLKVTMLNKENCPANEKKRYNIWKELLASINCKIVNSIAFIKKIFFWSYWSLFPSQSHLQRKEQTSKQGMIFSQSFCF